jgi:hypothetical protein
MADSFEDRTWSVDVYRVTDLDHQQRILRAFHDAARTDVTTLGTQNGSAWFVITETSSSDDRRWSRRTITALDTNAFRAYSFGKPPLLRRRTRSS